MSRQFGVVSTGSSFAGIVVQNYTENESVTIAEAKNEQGAVTDLHAYSKEKTIQVDGYVDGSVGITAGNTITVGGNTYLVESVSTTENNESYKKVSLSAKTADNAQIDALSSSSGD